MDAGNSLDKEAMTKLGKAVARFASARLFLLKRYWGETKESVF
jgi:hypothetical protein